MMWQFICILKSQAELRQMVMVQSKHPQAQPEAVLGHTPALTGAALEKGVNPDLQDITHMDV